MLTKQIVVPFEVKEVNEGDRTFRGLAATWDLDLGGDVIVKGAFKRTIAAWRKAKAKKHNLLDSHEYRTIFSVLGDLREAEETDAGVDCLWGFLPGATGDQAYDLVKNGNVHSLSIGYETVASKAASQDEVKRGIWRYILELKWLETSLVLFPMNPAATVDLATVKGLLEKGDALTEQDRAELVSVHGMISALLAKSAAPGTTPDPTPVAGLAPEDRAALAGRIRDLNLRHLGIGA